MLLCGLCRVLCVVVVMIWVCGNGFGCVLVVINLVMCVILIINSVLILFIIEWNWVKLIVWGMVLLFVMIILGLCFNVSVWIEL